MSWAGPLRDAGIAQLYDLPPSYESTLSSSSPSLQTKIGRKEQLTLVTSYYPGLSVDYFRKKRFVPPFAVVNIIMNKTRACWFHQKRYCVRRQLAKNIYPQRQAIQTYACCCHSQRDGNMGPCDDTQIPYEIDIAVHLLPTWIPCTPRRLSTIVYNWTPQLLLPTASTLPWNAEHQPNYVFIAPFKLFQRLASDHLVFTIIICST